MIVPSEYSEFATIFPTIYRKISERLNSQVSIERLAAFLNTERRIVYSYKPEFISPAFYLVYGVDTTMPAISGVIMFSKSGSGLILPFSSHSPSGVSLSIQATNGDLQLSLSSGEGTFEISLLFI